MSKSKKENFEDIKKGLKGTMYDGMIEGIIGLEDEIEFDCVRCGKCCTGRDYNGEPIMVSPLDIYNACKKLNITPEKFVKKYTQSNIGPTSGAVVLTLACDDDGNCKFLEYDENHLAKCKIHDSKPTICAIHPLGIMHSKKADSGEDFEKQYVVAAHCDESRHGVMTKAKDIVACVKGTDEEVDAAMAVRMEWLPKEGLKTILDRIMLHSILMTGLLDEQTRQDNGFSDHFYEAAKSIVKTFEDKVGPLNMTAADMQSLQADTMAPILTNELNIKFSYLEYDLSKPFLEQCNNNLATLKDYTESLTALADADWEDITGKLSKKQLKNLPEFIEVYPVIMQQFVFMWKMQHGDN